MGHFGRLPPELRYRIYQFLIRKNKENAASIEALMNSLVETNKAVRADVLTSMIESPGMKAAAQAALVPKALNVWCQRLLEHADKESEAEASASLISKDELRVMSAAPTWSSVVNELYPEGRVPTLLRDELLLDSRSKSYRSLCQCYQQC